jgi:hypothetical protein
VAKALTSQHDRSLARGRMAVVVHGPHPVEAAREAVDVAARVLTGDPTAGPEVIEREAGEREKLERLPQLHEVIAGRDQRKLRLLDIGCGTWRFLDIVKQVWPRLPSPAARQSWARCRSISTSSTCS